MRARRNGGWFAPAVRGGKFVRVRGNTGRRSRRICPPYRAPVGLFWQRVRDWVGFVLPKPAPAWLRFGNAHSGRRTAGTVSPRRRAFCAERILPATVFGPVLFCALARFAAKRVQH